ncbi:MAG: glycosyltransferase family 4 protein [Rhizobiales bacterium]|nr:glycosyltransferase family 4 protein [Hyphomicrobiales bacterium]
MRILITNIRMAMRSGTEVVVRDLALRLAARGHQPVVYTPDIGALAGELISHGVPVLDDLARLEQEPDIIHGHHTIPTAEAIMAFPGRPAIWLCHDATAWFDAAPRFAQIRRYFAVDETCRERLVAGDGLARESIGILPNAIDLRRIPPRTQPLPPAPRLAVSLVKHPAPIPLIREACLRLGLPLEAYGHGVGQEISDVENACAKADLVFATARTAIEAMATGAAVILVDGRGFGGIVTSANYDLFRRLNFGLGALRAQASVEALVQSIGSYDPIDAARLGARIRAEADLDKAVDRLEQIYADVIRQHDAEASLDARRMRQEVLAFNRRWLPNLQAPWHSWMSERAILIEERDALQHSLATLTGDHATAERARDQALRERDQALLEREEALRASADLQRSRALRAARFVRRFLPRR